MWHVSRRNTSLNTYTFRTFPVTAIKLRENFCYLFTRILVIVFHTSCVLHMSSISSFMIRPLYLFLFCLCIIIFLHFCVICHLFKETNKPHLPLTSGTFLLLSTHRELCSVTLLLSPSSEGAVVYT